MLAMHSNFRQITVRRLFAGAAIATALMLALVAAPALAQWPTTCVELNDIVEADLGNNHNVGIYQRVFGDRAEQACQNDHREDVQSTFAWAIPTPTAAPQPAPAPTPAPFPASPPIGEVTVMAASPFVFQDHTIWLGTSGGGVLRSTNTGATFTQVVSGLPNLTINAILASPNVHLDGVVLAATDAGVARSTNAGESWMAVSGLPAGRIGGLAASSDFANNNAFFAVADAGGLFESTDGGANWSPVPALHGNGLRPGRYLGLAAVDGRGSSRHVFAWTSTDLLGSNNDGRGFQSQLGRGALPNDLHISAVAIHPEFHSKPIIFVGSVQHGVYRSRNGGDDFTKVIENHKDELGRINTIALSPNITRDGTVAVGTTKKGVYISRKVVRLGTVTDPGNKSDWKHRNVNLHISKVTGLAFSNNYLQDRSLWAAGEAQFAFSHSGAADWFTYRDPVGPIG